MSRRLDSRIVRVAALTIKINTGSGAGVFEAYLTCGYAGAGCAAYIPCLIGC